MSLTSQRTIDLFDRNGVFAARRDPWCTTDHVVVIRRADGGDARLLVDLAVLDGAPPLKGDVLLALVDGEPWAAIALADGRVVADPFRPSAHAAELLRVRAERLQAEPAATGLRRRALLARRSTV
jgi:hypothetical protein